jgi:hypothetical protein
MPKNDTDAARAVAANKEQSEVSQLTNKSNINQKVSFGIQMTGAFELINLIFEDINFILKAASSILCQETGFHLSWWRHAPEA